MTLEEAKHTALDRAKISAIADAFGTLVTQNNSTVITNQNGESDNRFFSLGGSEVKGEWVETIKEPVYDVRYDGGLLIVSVEVVGRIRELVDAGLDLTVKILRNGVEPKYESTDFRNGDDLYLMFKSPIDGYLLAYMYDETSNQVVRILPYIQSTQGNVSVRADKEYVFFKKHRNDRHKVDEYTMTASKPVEFNTLYVIFSTKEITKTVDKSDEDKDGIRVLGFADFNKWLAGVKMQSAAKVTEKTIKVKQ
ncbi:MAG: DUF4384 domain-containing protein [Prevotella sp.]|nr:DUF4384 domain-containing protein [Prevotella sp.]